MRNTLFTPGVLFFEKGITMLNFAIASADEVQHSSETDL